MDYTLLTDIVDHMKNSGLRFKSDLSDRPQNAYAILGGKTSVRCMKNCKDGVNGIILYLAKDEEDKNRILHYFDKEVYPNGEKTRPFKMQIKPDELDQIIELLKENKRNI